MRVVVIGAGLSGLVAAVTLREAGCDVQVVEAAPHIGGRIRALRDPETGRPLADLGPTWVWPKYQPVADRWLTHLQLTCFAQHNDGDAIVEGFGPVRLRQPLPGQDGMVRIAGGPVRLIDGLAARLGAGVIRTASAVTGVTENGPERVDVHLASGGRLTAERVIVSVPLRVASSRLDLPWASGALIAAMRATPTWMATHAKAVALYERPFWRDAGLSGRIASRTGPLVEVHDHTPFEGTPGALFGFVGWPPERRAEDPAALRAAILDQLVACFGPAAADPIDLVVQDWAMSPEIATPMDLAGPMAHPEVGPPIMRRAQLGGRVRFAVSEASEISPGLIEGALAIGEGAARDLLART